jgi:hypothetical protein
MVRAEIRKVDNDGQQTPQIEPESHTGTNEDQLGPPYSRSSNSATAATSAATEARVVLVQHNNEKRKNGAPEADNSVMGMTPWPPEPISAHDPDAKNEERSRNDKFPMGPDVLRCKGNKEHSQGKKTGTSRQIEPRKGRRYHSIQTFSGMLGLLVFKISREVPNGTCFGLHPHHRTFYTQNGNCTNFA